MKEILLSKSRWRKKNNTTGKVSAIPFFDENKTGTLFGGTPKNYKKYLFRHRWPMHKKIIQNL
jgi:hypothetical protein